MHNLSRREFMRLSSLTAAATLAAACTQPTAPAAPAAPGPAAEQPTTAPVQAPGVSLPTAAPAPPTSAPVARYSEAPMLAERVTAGSLPPLDERLPIEPVIVPVWEEIGQYGGVWRRCATGVGDVGVIRTRFTGEPFMRFSIDASSIIPNVMKAYEINDDATEFTFFMREGMKWSDGEPFTADDFVFWYEDHFQNTDLTPNPGNAMRDPQNGNPLVLEKVDDYTFKVTFESPYGLFIQIVSGA
ncbi:MAG: ABC transporter substrate-binding protein, partial [Chloroflexi bacterium]|nr:ABC transporter substrate-binding protein [Chloroflexota bacterium]